MMSVLKKPSEFLKVTSRMMPWVMAFGLFTGALGLWFGLINSPADYQQGDSVRIMYVHVPASWGALATYTVMAVVSIIAFVTRAPLVHLIAKSLAPIGACFTLISLATGSIWGKPTWGTWWVWDARLTSMLFLLFLYFGYMRVVSAFEDEEKGLNIGALIAIVGWINIPIIKWSVDWWHTLHQPASIMRIAKPAIHSTMLLPLLLMAFAFAAYGFCVMVLRFHLEWSRRRLNGLKQRKVLSE